MTPEKLKGIAKQLRRDIKVAVTEGKLPLPRYAVHSKYEWYTQDIRIYSGGYGSGEIASDEVRKTLLTLAQHDNAQDDPFTVMIDQCIAFTPTSHWDIG